MKSIVPAFLFLLCLCFSTVSFAQNQKGELRGKLWDATHKEALPYATIAVYTAQDTTLVTFRVSDDKGGFKVPNLALNQPLRLVVTMTGLKVFRKEFSLSAAQPVLDLGQIDMVQSEHLLGEVVITAEAPPIVVRKDTLEFNAASFKTLPTALVEDLLKKLPGVRVDAEGNITVNGRAVQKILVDGKEFFGNDPKMATRNLPADMISKVQVVNDPEALRRNPDLAAGQIPQVINLKLKKGIKQGAFGKLYAGKGTDNRFEGGGILNIFRDTTQLSVLGFANNLNRPGFGFEEISRIGGFNRSGFNSASVWSDGGFAINGISFGGTGEGIQKSAGAGGNFNTLLKNNLTLNLQYFYGGMNADLNQVINTQQYLQSVSQLAADTLNTRRTRDQTSQNDNHRIGGKLEWKPDTLTYLSITPSITFAKGKANQSSLAFTTFNFSESANDSRDTLRRDDDRVAFSTMYSFERRFKKKGRIFSLSGDYEYSTTGLNQINQSVNNFYRNNPETTYLNQLRATDQVGLTTNNNLNFSEPIIKDLSATLRISSGYFSDENNVQTYGYDSERQVYDERNESLSDQVNRSGWRSFATAGLRWKVKELTLEPGVRFTKLDIENSFRKADPIDQHYFFVYPSLSVSWKDLNLRYNVFAQEPSATDLQPVPDKTNQLYIQFGNPGLQPTIAHEISLDTWKQDTEKSRNYNAYVYGSISQNAVTRARTIDLADGRQTSRPVNTNGNWSLGTYSGVMQDFKSDNNRQFSIGGGLNIAFHRSLILLDQYNQGILVNALRGYGHTLQVSPRIEGRMNLNDKLELNQEYSLRQQWGRYERNLANNIRITNQTSRSEIIVRYPKRLVWEASYNYWYNSNAAPGLQRSYGRLNAGVTFLFMKDNRGQLKLSIFDALDQNLSAYRNITENQVEDYQTVVLNRYGLLTFTYNIRNFGGKVGGSSNSFFRF